MPSTTTPNMSLVLPTVGTQLAPDWAENLNSDLTAIDQHAHTPGQGVPITPAAMDINVDLTLQSHNLLEIRSTRFTSQTIPISEPTDLDCIYVSGVDLYYNDGDGNQVRITQSGAVAGTPGSIANLVSPASATYVSATPAFVWQSDANTSADMDGGSVIIRENVANAKGITLRSPTSLANDYGLTLMGALPASSKIVTINASGNIAASTDTDNSTLEISSNTIRVKDGGITLAKMAANSVGASQIVSGSVTQVKMGAVGQQTDTVSSFSTSSTSFVDVTGLSVTITTTGRPVLIGICGVDANVSFITVQTSTSQSSQAEMRLIRDGSTVLSYTRFGHDAVPYGATPFIQFPPPGIIQLDAVAAGTYTYTVKVKLQLSNCTISLSNIKLIAWEM